MLGVSAHTASLSAESLFLFTLDMILKQKLKK